MFVSSSLNIHDSIHVAKAKERIRFPLHSSTNILNKNIFEPLSETFKFSNGGTFISDANTVIDDNIPRVLELITSLLKYDECLIPKGDENGQENVYIGKYDFLPSIFLNLAYHSRVDSGYRLLDRCARHTCDPKSGSIFYQEAKFF